jgi:putative ABC transport system substrate-binding protein
VSTRLVVLLMATCLLVAPGAATAQQPGKLPRIGVLSPTPPPPPTTPQVEQLLQGLRELGYENGKTAIIEIRYAANNPDRVAELAAELVRLQVDVIATSGDLSTRVLQRATRTIPIVTSVGFPVESGFVASLARPGGNITGVAVQADELAVKRLELLKQALPRMTRVALLWDTVTSERQVRAAEAGARSLGLQLQPLKVGVPGELPGAFEAAARGRVEGMSVLVSPMLGSSRELIVTLAGKHRLPAMYPYREFVEAGGLMSYGPNFANTQRILAAQIDRILKGAKPADLPFQQATKFDLLLNLKTAKALGLTLPQPLLLRADQVIE